MFSPTLRRLRCGVAAAAALLASVPVLAQNVPPAARTARALQEATQRAAQEALLADLESRRAALAAAQAGLRDAADKAELVRRIEALQTEVQQLEWKLDSLVAGLDVKEFDHPEPKPTDLKAELERLVQPLVQWLKNLTSGPREIEDMNARIEALGQRLQTARGARERVRKNLAALPDQTPGQRRLREEIQRLEEGWNRRVRSIEQEHTVLQAELENRESQRTSLWDTIARDLDQAVRKRGLNLLLAVAAFIAVFVSLRFVQRRFTRFGRRRDERTFSLRLVEVVLHVMVVVAAGAATLITLYALGDWALLAVAIVFLLGIGWATIRMLPQYFEQVRLMLNLGSVREGERILLDGLPWRVDSLKFYSVMRNPDLQGGLLRMPLRDLVGKRSRPMHEDEPWFPCRVGDIVLLSDGTRGKVITQTPEVLVMSHFGCQRTYTTSSFLGMSPRNLSRGFVIDALFGVDYRHQAMATRVIPARFESVLRAGLPQVVDPQLIRSIAAEFRQAGTSSLDVLVLVELDGAAAADYGRIQRAVSRILVDTCTENGWVIPFTQVTLHQASA